MEKDRLTMFDKPKFVLKEIDWNLVSADAIEEITLALNLTDHDYRHYRITNPTFTKGVIIAAPNNSRLAKLLQAGETSWLVINKELPSEWPKPTVKGKTKTSFAHMVQV